MKKTQNNFEKMSIVDQENPLVSIIVVTYNSSQYVVETLESAKDQTYENIELIVTDDCSDDNTVEICKNWINGNEGRFARVELITSQTNTGTSSNINRGIVASHGLYIKETAGDDILLKNCIQDNIEFALRNNASFVFSEMLYFRKNELNEYEDIELNERYVKLQYLYKAFSKLDYFEQTVFYSRQPIFLNSPTWFYQKSKITFLDEDFKLVEDQPLIFRYLETNEKVSYLDKTTVRYRRYDDNTNSIKYFQYFDDFIRCFAKYRKKNLRKSSLVDLSFIIHFYIEIYLSQWSKNSIFRRILLFPFKKLNPVQLFNISPSNGLS